MHESVAYDKKKWNTLNGVCMEQMISMNWTVDSDFYKMITYDVMIRNNEQRKFTMMICNKSQPFCRSNQK